MKRLLPVALLLLPGPCSALAFTDICAGGVMFALRQTSTGVEVRCPDSQKPKLTIEGCLAAVAYRDKVTGKIILQCGAGSTFKTELKPGS